MVKDRLAQRDAVEQGWLLDGYPRSGEQAEAIEAAAIRPDLFFLINVSRQGFELGFELGCERCQGAGLSGAGCCRLERRVAGAVCGEK